jgi:glycosyltransferase involved in cell wall biosynthesis
MRVVIIADFAEPVGGALAVALESARALAERGVPVTYVHGVGDRGHALLDHPLIERVGFGFSDIWDLPKVKAVARGVWNPVAAQRLTRLIGELPPGPTVLHLHQWTRSLSPSVFGVLVNSGHPVAVTTHDYFLACPNGVYYRFELGKPCWVRPMSVPCLTAPCDPRNSFYKAVRTMRTGLMNRELFGKRLDLIHVSDLAQRTIEPLLGIEARHHRVDNPIRVAKAEPARLPADGPVAFVGRLTREKGADLLAEAARLAGVPALFIGDGPAADEIRTLNPQAELLGWRPAEDVDRLLRERVRAVVAPSRWYETGPLTVLEAAAAGVPAIVSERAGAAEKVVDGVTGFVTEPAAEALAGALRRLGEVDAAALGRAAFERFWSDPPTPERHGADLLAVYRTMLDRVA